VRPPRAHGSAGDDPALYIAQRATAFVLAFAVTIHLVTIIYAIRGGLTAGEILARTHGNRWFLGFYLIFVLAAAIHAPIGLRSVLREWRSGAAVRSTLQCWPSRRCCWSLV